MTVAAKRRKVRRKVRGSTDPRRADLRAQGEDLAGDEHATSYVRELRADIDLLMRLAARDDLTWRDLAELERRGLTVDDVAEMRCVVNARKASWQ